MSSAYNRQKQRQLLITNLITAAQTDKYQSVQSALCDPFETYYYPTPLEDIHQLQQLETKIRNNIIQLENVNKMKQIQEELKNQLYIVQQRIIAEQMENQVLDGLIAGLQGRVAAMKIQKELKNNQDRKNQKDTRTFGMGCQTQEVKVKQQGTMYYEQFSNMKTNQKKKKQLFTLPAYSLTIHTSNTNPSAVPTSIISIQKQRLKQQISKSKPSSIVQKKNPYQVTKKPSQKLNPPKKTIPHTQTQPSSDNQLNLNSLYQQLKKQIQYLKHLKMIKQQKSKTYNINNYKQQKRKVKFLMQLFWKNAANQNPVSNRQNDMDSDDFVLPFIQL